MDFTNVQGEWKQIKAYIDSKLTSSGGVSGLPIGTELMSYSGSNIFGDKFVREDGKYYKRSETSFDFGPIKSISPARKYIQTTTEEGSTVLIYFNGYYYTNKYNKWCKSQTIDGQFFEAPELKDYSDYSYIGNGAFYSSFNKKVIILGGTQYSIPENISSVEYYKDGYFITSKGITKDFKTYTHTETGRFSFCENEGYFWIEDSTNHYLRIYDHTGKLIAKFDYSKGEHLGSFRNVAYCKATNTAYVSTYVSSTHYEGVIYFGKNTSKMNTCSGNVYRNIFGSIVISAVEDSEEFTVSDCYENFPTYKFSTKGLTTYKLQIFSISIFNGVPYVRCRYHNTYYNNYDCRYLIEITGLYSNDIYCQAKNSPSTFVKVK